MEVYPLLMDPCYKEMPWGGERLNLHWGKHSPFLFTGESWEAAAHANGCSAVADGPLKGLTPANLTVRFDKDFCGTLPLAGPLSANAFPLLFKLIDARDRLSVQVHPDAAHAGRFGGQSKTEMWMVLDAEPGAGLYLGFKHRITIEEFRRRIIAQTLENALFFIPCAPGDVFFVPAGLLHAIGAGLLVAEIQQSADTTYRVYDWGRLGLDGKPRPLHIDKAISAVRPSYRGEKAWVPAAETRGARSDNARIEFLPFCRYFGARRILFSGRFTGRTLRTSFRILFIAEGRVRVCCGNGYTICGKGATVLIPACADAYRLEGSGMFYEFFVPDYERDYLRPLVKAGYSASHAGKLYKDVD